MSATNSDAPARSLNRVLGPGGVMMLTFSALSPVSGVYLGGDAVLHLAGSGAAIAFIIGGVISYLMALLFAELGAAYPRAGGIYPGVGAVLGPQWAFPFLVLAVPGAFAFVGFVALGMADYVRVLFPALPTEAIAVVSIALGATIAALNVRAGEMVTGAFLAIEAAALVLLTAVAVMHPARPLAELLMHPMMLDQGSLKPVSVFTLGLATVSGVWVTAGANWAMFFGEEMRDAQRKIGRVIAWTGFLAALSIAAPMVLMLMSAGNLPDMLSADAPVAAYLAKAGGPTITTLVSIGVIAALFNNVIASCMVFARLIYSTGRDQIWSQPINRWLSYLHPRWRSPTVATAVVGVLASLATLLGEKYLLIFLSGDVSQYALTSFAVWLGRPRGITGKYYRIPGGPALPIFGLVFTLLSILADWMDPDAGRPSLIVLGSLFVAALIYYHTRLRNRPATWLAADLAGDAD